MCKNKGTNFTHPVWAFSPEIKMWLPLQPLIHSIPTYQGIWRYFFFFALAKLKFQSYGHCCPQCAKKELGEQKKMGLLLFLNTHVALRTGESLFASSFMYFCSKQPPCSE